MKIFEKVKVAAAIVLLIVAFIAINVWLARGDREMLKQYMADCAKMKAEGILKPDVDCYEQFVNAYRTNFRRNP